MTPPIDACAPLVEAARAADRQGQHQVVSYDGLVSDPAAAGVGYDLVVANFALLGDPLQPLLAALAQAALAPGGSLVVQTVHPLSAPDPYVEGWRMEDFCTFSAAQPWAPMPWYFRTFGGWISLLRDAGYRIDQVREPLHPQTGTPASLLLAVSKQA